ncbi:hypothetical protein P152DRAFT_489208 [Eremomyces bilateralis CBS 781.70]|uniref:SMP-30/Gluconolactonase/LRE-like region domain-containing protein n=1 Tax=Eremomyces bilateralis CBS 781.70 TaxID=1392243 RepID=A0A6G1G046_9PEZI|nr:uncharacterized protein P152DRAFT_489208 [Eremomyces bilateralis CBS 781.70]KAF1811485.1 hypothetical protein P152DRAFT_489208 [Eremomyces bilateralis CBS 781.70]
MKPKRTYIVLIPGKELLRLRIQSPMRPVYWASLELRTINTLLWPGNSKAPPPVTIPDTLSVWKIDFQGRPKARQLASFSDTLLNGITMLEPESHIALIAESSQGLIYALDIRTGEYRLFLDDPALKSPFLPDFAPIGINGIHMRGQYAYFTNSYAETFNKVKVDLRKGQPVGSVEMIPIATVADGFDLAGDGNAYLCGSHFQPCPQD